MARALVVEFIAGEDAGALGRWLPAAGLDLDVVRLHAGDVLPARVEHEALIVMGGKQDAFGTGEGQPETIALLRAAMAGGTAVLGVCLGAQLLALAAGGTVARNPDGPEQGWGLVRKGDACADDPILRSLPYLPDVVHWHQDEIATLPPGATHLLRNGITEVQGFRVGEKAWGLQCHIEVDEAMVARWADEDDVDRSLVLPFPPDVDLERTWRPVAEAFARVARGGFTGVTLTAGTT
jgi:GMP synthase-like glutamine amidotransferase